MSIQPGTALVERLWAVESTAAHDDATTCWHRNPDGPEAAALIASLVEALEAIASNDEYPVDAEGNPMPIRPQWSREQCSSIARAALAKANEGEGR